MATPSLCLSFCLWLLFFLSKRFFLSLSSLSWVTKQFDGWIGIWIWVPITYVKSEWNCTVGLFSGKFLDMDAPFLTVDSCDFSFSVLEGSSHDLDGITLTDGNRADIVSGFQILSQVATHDLSSNVWWCWEMSLSWLSSLTWDAYTPNQLQDTYSDESSS